ncbi:MAG: phage tail protein [Actinomycetota bacterium]|nr:phage tail protein [Actinomycetota bacterium]
MANGSSRTMDPPFSGRFIFSVAAVGEIGAFTECSGLSAEIEVEEVKEGGQNHFSHKLPGRIKWPNIVLKRGITDADNLFEWFQKASGEGFAGEGNTLTRSEGEVALVDSKGQTVRKWEFEEAFPVKWTGPSLASSSNAPSVEELEIAHHGFRASSG